MTTKDLKNIHGCFKCGAIDKEIRIVEDVGVKCGDCGEFGIVTFEQALDLLADYSRDYGRHLDMDDHEYYEIIMELQEQDG